MALRVTTQEVKDFYPHLPSSITSADPYISVANSMVNLLVADKGLQDDNLKQIELLLTCHYIEVAIYRGGLRTYQVGESRESYNTPSNATSYGIAATSYGQQAIALDISNSLRDHNRKERPAQFRVVKTGS